MNVKSQPDDYHPVTPSLVVDGVAALIEFLRAAFGVFEIGRTERVDGSVQHARVRIGDSHIMMGEPRGPLENHAGDALCLRG